MRQEADWPLSISVPRNPEDHEKVSAKGPLFLVCLLDWNGLPSLSSHLKSTLPYFRSSLLLDNKPGGGENLRRWGRAEEGFLGMGHCGAPCEPEQGGRARKPGCGEVWALAPSSHVPSRKPLCLRSKAKGDGLAISKYLPQLWDPTEDEDGSASFFHKETGNIFCFAGHMMDTNLYFFVSCIEESRTHHLCLKVTILTPHFSLDLV